MKQLFSLALLLCCSLPNLASAQSNQCYGRDQYDDRRSCERDNQSCEYNSRTGCYEPERQSTRCDERRDEYEDRRSCERDNRQGCDYKNGCYVPARDQERPRCDINHDEYDTESRCERANPQGCDYERSSGCYVPGRVNPPPPPPPPPSCPSTMPTNVCTSGSREEYGTGWGDIYDCDRKLIENFGTSSGKSCYQKANCCWGIH